MDVWKEGVGGTDMTAEALASVFAKQELQLTSADDLEILDGELEWFTPAIAYVYGGLTDVLWFDLSRELGHDLPLFFWRCGQPILRGLTLPDGDEDWNAALWATHKVYWPLLRDFLLSVVFHDRVRGTACGFGVQTLRLRNVLACPLTTGDRLHMSVLNVTAFGINGSDRRVAFAPLDARIATPSVRLYEPSKEMMGVAETLRRGTVGPDLRAPRGEHE